MIIEIAGLNHQGEGVGRVDGMVYFVPQTVPGDVVKIIETERFRRYRRGRLVDLIKSSPDRMPTGCALQDTCGGCGLQHMSYKAELSWKRQLVIDSLERIGHLPGSTVEPAIGMEEPCRYRNKVTFHVQHEPRISLGFYRAGTHDVVPVNNCSIISREIIEVAARLESLFRKAPEKAKKIKEIAVRQSFFTKELMVIFMSGEKSEGAMWSQMAADIQMLFPSITTVAVSDNSDRTRILSGTGYLVDKINGVTFSISPGAFFQTNTRMAEVLVDTVLKYADLVGTENVIDGYCGIGTLALPLARKARKVTGVELNAVAIDDALDNAAANGFNNVEFIAGNCAEVVPHLIVNRDKIDLLVLDPPRQGLETEVIDSIIKHQPPRIIYVSCHPGTLARDLGRITVGGYVMKKLQPVDMFPRTPHVECVVLMSRAGK